MDSVTIADVKKRIAGGESPDAIRNELVSKGFLDEDVSTALNIGISAAKKSKTERQHTMLGRKFTVKELFDRAGFGFGSLQYLNILFFLAGANYFLIGIINGLKTFLGVFVSSFLDQYHRRFRKLKEIVFLGGIIYAASFLIMGIAKYYNIAWLFGAGMIVGGLAIVVYGNCYQKLLEKQMPGEGKSPYLNKLNKAGSLVAALSLVAAALILNKAELGYATVFWIAAAAFIIGSFSMLVVHEKPVEELRKLSFQAELREYFSDIHHHIHDFIHDKVILILLITGTVMSLVQTLGYSYYGLFIYQNLSQTGFGRYLNVAIIFIFAIIGSFVGSFITKKNAREYGKFPMLTFGTLLVAIMPLTFFYNTTLIAMSMATILGVVGSTIVGISRGILTVELIPERKRAAFFKASTVLMTLPYVLAIPIGALIAQHAGIRILFLVLAITMIVIVVPLYFAIVLMHHKKRKI
ncbi:MFS transporter [Candidatus Woesearchaeota archaeon]|nr:MFS transporter [Candidatus Woesearchaeota archaeon]